ncbi:hypothetical protein DC366_03590 [Pelagivirga sediminicola]|uniref:Uncharacterized protein n=1 Tax=Pelagivirga sediminicola TaxID=2170575 RepID=A0A2T7GC79_9RHOB|nr:hypothetical protein DC366_03590 [Pelagivirga sediminicola]
MVLMRCWKRAERTDRNVTLRPESIRDGDIIAVDRPERGVLDGRFWRCNPAGQQKTPDVRFGPARFSGIPDQDFAKRLQRPMFIAFEARFVIRFG